MPKNKNVNEARESTSVFTRNPFWAFVIEDMYVSTAIVTFSKKNNYLKGFRWQKKKKKLLQNNILMD